MFLMYKYMYEAVAKKGAKRYFSGYLPVLMGPLSFAHAKEEGHKRTPSVRFHYKCETEGRYN